NLAAPFLLPPRRGFAVDPNVEILTPSSSAEKVQIPPTPLELRVGKLVALAASAVAAAVRDYGAAGRMTVATKSPVGDLFAELVELRRLMVPHWDFDGIAHQHGRQWLVEACGPVSVDEERIIGALVNSTMEILRKTALLELH